MLLPIPGDPPIRRHRNPEFSSEKHRVSYFRHSLIQGLTHWSQTSGPFCFLPLMALGQLSRRMWVTLAIVGPSSGSPCAHAQECLDSSRTPPTQPAQDPEVSRPQGSREPQGVGGGGMRGHRIRLGTFPEPQGQETSEGAGARLAHLPWEPRALTRSARPRLYTASAQQTELARHPPSLSHQPLSGPV